MIATQESWRPFSFWQLRVANSKISYNQWTMLPILRCGLQQLRCTCHDWMLLDMLNWIQQSFRKNDNVINLTTLFKIFPIFSLKSQGWQWQVKFRPVHFTQSVRYLIWITFNNVNLSLWVSLLLALKGIPSIHTSTASLGIIWKKHLHR